MRIDKVLTDLDFADYEIIKKTGTIIIPEDVTVIGKSAFSYAPLKHITIPNNIRIIEDYAFSSSSIESVKFESKMPYMSEKAFDNCKKLTDITIDNSIFELNDLIKMKIKEDYFSDTTTITATEPIEDEIIK